ncbi:hypothetical protein FH608_035610 [Nonomuraea phyllanthi]|uniref:WD40 repeat domain-containing protein n=1 Tax=Nonomuraea phyllanthi TaxID=2219224 RepID=A0A5C4VVN0_9ACTN|nr:hypothetical protein [Nonomuraea phyllanthi]KAB8190302.1 hypothetical protein FH608_035610 [Nonomuraea phyllanthi]
MKTHVVIGAALGAALVFSTAASAAPAPDLSGAVYAGFGHQLTRYANGEWSTLARIGATQRFAASPDGTKAAWVTDGGDLQVSLNGRTTTLVRGLRGGTPCMTPVWSSDSATVAYPARGGRIMAVKADGSAAPRKLGTSKGVCHLAWSADGRYLAGHTGQGDGLYRLDAKTGRSTQVKGVRYVNHVQSLSPDGSKAIIAIPDGPDEVGDGTWPSTFTPVVVDMATGKRQRVPVKGRQLGAFYLRDGRLVARTAGTGGQSGAAAPARNVLVVLDSAGRPVQRIDEPTRARKHALLQVLP